MSTANLLPKCEIFRAMHVPGDPLVLFNAWNAGSAMAIERAGARAIATSSWAVAAALGYDDGERLPLEEALRTIGRMASRVSVPMTADFEGGYAVRTDDIERNVARLVEQGVVGLNFEDQVVGGDGLYAISDQAIRIGAVRAAAERAGVALFVNARTDLFLDAGPKRPHGELLDEAIARAQAYMDAGADGLFVPGLQDHTLIARLCERVDMPVNVMILSDPVDTGALARLGVARISMGPAPYLRAVDQLEQAAMAMYSGGSV